jgi:lysophospholipase
VRAAWLLLAALTAWGADWRVRAPRDLEEQFRAPVGIEWGFFQNGDGARIRYSRTPAAAGREARGTVILLHGYSEFGEKYFELMREFAGRGYEVWQMDWRGYGGSDRFLAAREKAHSRGVWRELRDVEQFRQQVARPSSGGPVYLVAHSMGGHLATRYLQAYPGRFRAAILSSPFLSLAPEATQGLPEWMVEGVVFGAAKVGLSESWAKGNGPWRDRTVDALTHDAARADLQRRWCKASPVLRIGGVTNGWVAEYLLSMEKMQGAGFLEGVRTPVLLGSATADVLTKAEEHTKACGRMASCRLVRLEGAWHELFLEEERFRQRWMEEVWRFLDAHH